MFSIITDQLLEEIQYDISLLSSPETYFALLFFYTFLHYSPNDNVHP